MAETFKLNKENMIGLTQFGALYKGAERFSGFIVKTWGDFDREFIIKDYLLDIWYRFKVCLPNHCLFVSLISTLFSNALLCFILIILSLLYLVMDCFLLILIVDYYEGNKHQR